MDDGKQLMEHSMDFRCRSGGVFQAATWSCGGTALWRYSTATTAQQAVTCHHNKGAVNLHVLQLRIDIELNPVVSCLLSVRRRPSRLHSSVEVVLVSSRALQAAAAGLL